MKILKITLDGAAANEGERYSYFTMKGGGWSSGVPGLTISPLYDASTDKESGAEQKWWLRSPDCTDDAAFNIWGAGGYDKNKWNEATYSRAVAPGFCI